MQKRQDFLWLMMAWRLCYRDMGIIFEQVIILFVFMMLGYFLCKTNIVEQEHSKILSVLLVYVFLPSNIFRTFATNFTIEYISLNYEIVICSFCTLLALMLVMRYVARIFSKDSYERCVYEYSMIVPNYGYMGYVLAENLYGESGLMSMMMFALPVSIYIYTIGFSKLTKTGIQLKKLCNPVMISTVLGIVAGLVGIPIPTIGVNILTKASACMAPISMILAGIVIAQFEIKTIARGVKNYVVTVLRLLVIPIVIGVILNLKCDSEIVRTATLFYALPCGLNTIVFAKMVDADCSIGASLALLSNVLACVTIPIVVSLF